MFPALVLNYFGQAALLRSDPEAIESPFYRLAPSWAITPLAILATMATVIASQALISGAFSMTAQAIQLDYIPRLAVRHTSGQHAGQIYVPLVNWLLMLGCVGLVLGFRSSSALASAYGIAVTATMAITTLLFFKVVQSRFGWSSTKAAVILLPLLVVDLAFLAANVPKIPHGGWFPLLIAFVLVVQMTTWRRGRDLVAARLRRAEVPMTDTMANLGPNVLRVAGTAVYLFKDAGATPPALLANLEHHTVLHENVLLVAIEVSEAAYLDAARRVDGQRSRRRGPSGRHLPRVHGRAERGRRNRQRRGRRAAPSIRGPSRTSSATRWSSPATSPGCTRGGSTCSSSSIAAPTAQPVSSTCPSTAS